jgi:hypothetical protein
MDEEDVISLHNFGKVFYKYIPENEETGAPAHYDKVEVSDENPWVAGLEPRVVTEDGKLVLGWYEPNPTTIEGVNDQVTAVQGTVADLEASVGAPSTENSEATGLYKEVEEVQEDVEELVDTIGTTDDSLSENVQTIWAHVNNHTERLEVLEGVEFDSFATKTALEEEVERAKAAEKANADAIKAIADDYLTESDKYDDTALANRVTAVEEAVAAIDYVDADELATELVPYAKIADVNTALEGKADKDEFTALKGKVEAFLEGTGTEEALDSLKELIEYIDAHDGADLTDMVATL